MATDLNTLGHSTRGASQVYFFVGNWGFFTDFICIRLSTRKYNRILLMPFYRTGVILCMILVLVQPWFGQCKLFYKWQIGVNPQSPEIVQVGLFILCHASQLTSQCLHMMLLVDMHACKWCQFVHQVWCVCAAHCVFPLHNWICIVFYPK